MFGFVRFLRVLFFLFPAGVVKNFALRATGITIGKSSSIGPCLVLGSRDIIVGSGCRIGPFNVFRDLKRLEIGDKSRIGQWNWISTAKPLVEAGAEGCFVMGNNSALTSRHYIDASGGVYIGNFTTMAGVRSTLITHGINWKSGKQNFRQIKIGDYCLISSSVNVAPGTVVADKTVVGMGATLSGENFVELGLYVQPRASRVKDLSGTYFNRSLGYISEISTGKND